MARPFKLPDLGEGIHEGEVIAVLVAAGDTVTEGDPILEVETDKAAVEIPSPFTGKILEVRVKPGQIVKVGDVLMTFSNGKEETTSDEPPSPPPAAEPPADAGTAPPLEETPPTAPVPASPATRRLARELGVDLRRVSPTGPGGVVTAEDVRGHAEKGSEKSAAVSAPASPEPAAAGSAPPPLPDFSRWGPVERTPLRSIRRVTTRQMALAWSQIPHVSSQDEIDVTRLEEARRRYKTEVESSGGRLTLTVFAVKAAAAALRRFPRFNVSVDLARGEIIRKKYCHIGVATDTGDGLVVPVVRNADCKSMTELAVEIEDLVERTRARKIRLEELQGGTFTLTNIGASGGRGHFSPIINYPEAAILGLGQARPKPVVKTTGDGQWKVVPRLILPAVLAIDHRVLDGVDAVRFLEFFRQMMEDPEKLLLSA